MEISIAEVVRTVALACSATVSLTSAIIAFSAVRCQRDIAKHTANINRLQNAANLILDEPTLLELHGVSLEKLQGDDLTEKELLYLFYLFEAGDIYYRIEGGHEVTLTHPRKVLLRNSKVRLAWRKYLDNKIFHPTPFSKAINEYIDMNYPNERTQTMQD